MNPIHYIYFGFLFATLIHFTLVYREMDVLIKPFLAFLVIKTVGSTIMKFVTVEMNIRNNLFIAHIQTPLEYLALSILFYHALQNQFMKKAVFWSGYLFLIIAVLLSEFVQTPEKNNAYARVLEALLVTTLVLSYFRQVFLSGKVFNLKLEPFFWISTALLAYFLGTMFLQGSLNYLIEKDILVARKLYQFQYLFEFIFFILIHLALICRSIFRQQVESTAHSIAAKAPVTNFGHF